MTSIRICYQYSYRTTQKLTTQLFFISFKTLNDARICLQTAFSELIEIIHHVVVTLVKMKIRYCDISAIHVLN